MGHGLEWIETGSAGSFRGTLNQSTQERLSQEAERHMEDLVQAPPPPKPCSFYNLVVSSPSNTPVNDGPFRNLFQTHVFRVLFFVFLFNLHMILNQHYETYLLPLLRGE